MRIFVLDQQQKKGAKSQPVTPRDVGSATDTSPGKQRKSVSSESSIAGDSTLVRIQAFLVDGNSSAYTNIYNRFNRNVNVDFNSLDCKVS